ncbi:MAG: hypothetical protein HXS54_01940, partial [Theionarchaea archaeon]|nr:hypothetical protein [Theionarchaea archaeon]
MGRISQETIMKNYYKIFEQIHENPLISIHNISANTKFSKNTISKYMKEMYVKNVLVGPYLRMKQALNYREYVYLLKFSDPLPVLHGLKEFPHVICNAMTFGDWNTMVVTDRMLDFSRLVGFEKMISHNVKYCSYTSRVEYMTWDESFNSVYEQLDQFTPVRSE